MTQHSTTAEFNALLDGFDSLSRALIEGEQMLTGCKMKEKLMKNELQELRENRQAQQSPGLDSLNKQMQELEMLVVHHEHLKMLGENFSDDVLSTLNKMEEKRKECILMREKLEELREEVKDQQSRKDLDKKLEVLEAIIAKGDHLKGRKEKYEKAAREARETQVSRMQPYRLWEHLYS